jgi:hypothetical protein
MGMRRIFRHLHPGPSLSELKEFARRGKINPDAPVSARAQATVDVSAEDAWKVISEAGRWHNWHPAVRALESDAHVASCGPFAWKSNGLTVKSEVVLVEKNSAICWVGTAMGTKAVHAWRLKELGPKQTLIETEESMDGPLISVLYSRTKLEGFLVQWLNCLKAECERGGSRPM